MTTEVKPYSGFRGLVKGATGDVSGSPTIQKLSGSRGTIIRRPR
jgi:hypothetical protein